MIFYTENGGDTWEIQQSFTDHFIYGLDAVSIEKAIIGTPYSGIIDYYRFIPDVVSMSLSSDKEELFVGDTLTVEVRIGDLNEAEDVIGASLELSWDSDALQYIEDSAEIGDFFSENPLFFATKKDGERVLDLSSGSGLSQGKNGSGSLARMKFKDGFLVPLHDHVNEQVTQVISGTMRFWFGENKEQTMDLGPGDSVVIPAHVPHEALMIGDVEEVDTWSPIREDWLDGTDDYLRK